MPRHTPQIPRSQGRDRWEASRRRPSPGRHGAGALGPGRGERRVLACELGAAAVGEVPRRTRAAPGGAGARSDAASAAVPVYPALPVLVAGGAWPEPECGTLPREWAGTTGLGRRSCVLLWTQAISCLVVWEKERKKKSRMGAGGVGGGEPESRGG